MTEGQQNIAALLAQKLHGVMKTVEYLQRDGENKFHDYKYASEASIKRHYRDAFLKNGVAFGMEVVSVDNAEVVRKKSQTLATVKIACSFTDIDTGHSITRTGFGQGIDDGDKAVYKAITGALKYVITGNFLTPTGDDPEAFNPEADDDHQPEAQAPRGPDPKMAARAAFAEAAQKYGCGKDALERALEASLHVDDLATAKPEAIIIKLGALSKMPVEEAKALIAERAGETPPTLEQLRKLNVPEQMTWVGLRLGDVSGVTAWVNRNFDVGNKIPMGHPDIEQSMALLYEMPIDEAREQIAGKVAA